MKRNKKLATIALSVMLVMTLAVTVVSFSLANLRSGNNAPSVPGISTTATGAALTNVDYIIKAGSEEGSEPYKIVEIGSKRVSGNTAFGSFSTDGSFKEYVLKGNTTLTDTTLIDKFIANGTIDYKYYYSGDVNNDNPDALADVAAADLIYVSAESAYNKYTNDLSEELYNILHVAAVGDYKPFIIDKASSAGKQQEITGNYTIDAMIARYYIKMGYQYKTYYWNDTDIGSGSTTAEATKFYQAAIGSGSNYVGINGRVRQEYWMDVKTSDTASDKFKMADVLVISPSGSSLGTEPMFKKLMAGSTEVTSLYEVKNETTATAITVESNQKLYNIAGTPIQTDGYNKRYNVKPDYIRATEVALSQLEPSTSENPTLYGDLDFTDYDMVIFADECTGDPISADLYKKLVGVMYANVQVVYNYSLGTGGTGGSSGSVTDETKATKFYELYTMVATQDDIARYPNVMITDKAKMDIITASKSAETCKCIADIINNGSFRGIGGPGSTSTVFTVLEIQPCYPIDLNIANAKGEYYTIPSEVANNKTKEQLGIVASTDASGNVVYTTKKADGTVVNGTANAPQYYAWELSEAKVADALGMDVKQVKVVHMSSEEFATVKDAVLGNYDMVYVGGNTSALKSAFQWHSLGALANWGYSYNSLSSASQNMLPIFTMYTHTGDMMKNELEVEQGPVPSGTPINSAPGKKNTETLVTLNGNDITYNGLKELTKFVDAGMPVVISKDVKLAYDIVKGKDNPYLQNSIDPDSYVYAFLKYCDGKSSVTWGFDYENTELVDNDAGRLGDTLTGEVEVFKDDADPNTVTLADSKTTFKNAYLNNGRRPKLAVTSMPAVYNLYDPTSITTTLNLTFKFDVTGSSNYDVYLYADYNKNSLFDESSNGEQIASGSNTNQLTVNLATLDNYGSTYSGPVYWKLKVVDKATGTAVSTQKLAYIKTGDSPKKTVRVLQILPDKTLDMAYAKTEGGNKWVSLIFCTECQRAYEILDKNPGTNFAFLSNTSDLYDGKIGQDKLDSNGCHAGIYTGKHEHRFGIVRYENSLGMDDWYYNLADDVSDMYDFDIDIMDSREFEQVSAQVRLSINSELNANYQGKKYDELTDSEKETLANDLNSKADLALTNYNNVVEFDDVLESQYPGKKFEELTADEKAALRLFMVNGATDNARKNIDYSLAIAEHDLKNFILGRLGKSSNDTINNAFYNIYYSEQYADYVLYFKDTQNLNADWKYSDYKTYYEAYAHAKDKQLELKEAYKKASRLANFENWLGGSYDCVIIGPAETFCGDDIKRDDALNSLKTYIKEGGSVLMYHDTLTKFTGDGQGAVKLTQALLDDFGMDKNHAELDTSKYGSGVTIAGTKKQLIDNNDNYTESFSIKTEDGTTILCNNARLTAKKDKMSLTVINSSDQNDNGNRNADFSAGSQLSGPGLIEFTVTILNKGTNTPYANKNVTFTMRSGTYTGTTDANGKVVLNIKNYTEVQTTYNSTDAWYFPYKLKSGYDKQDTVLGVGEYQLPNISYRPWDDATRYVAWKDDLSLINASAASQAAYKYYSPLYAFTDAMNLGHNENVSYSPYRYATVNIKDNTLNGYSASLTSLGSNKASKTNQGIMTMYPFNLSDELNVAPTHPQAYAIDLQNKDLSVWYTIAGGSSSKKGSEFQGATPHDGTDNYFIYSVGNLNYCGAGHTRVTGQNKNNNDERMLYINIICNSVTNIPSTNIFAWDYTSTDSNKTYATVKPNGSEYIYKIEEDDKYPEFSFEFEMGKGQNLKEINVYYDIDGNGTFTTGIDKKIKTYNANTKENTLLYIPVDIKSDDELALLELKPEYLTNGKYVYIVIDVVDTKGVHTRKKIKVEIKDKLYNLT